MFYKYCGILYIIKEINQVIMLGYHPVCIFAFHVELSKKSVQGKNNLFSFVSSIFYKIFIMSSLHRM